MFNASEEYKNAMNKTSIVSKFEGKVTLKSGVVVSITDATIAQGSFSINSKCVSNSDFEYGAVYCAELLISIKSEVDRYSFYEGIIEGSYFLKLASGEWEEVPLGIYKIAEAERAGQNVSLKAYCRMNDMDEAAAFSVLYGTPYEIVTTLATMHNLELANTQEEIEGMQNGQQILGLNAMADITVRDLLSYLATILCAFVMFDRYGKLKIVSFAKEVSYTASRKRKTSTAISDFKVTYCGLRTKVNGETVVKIDEEKEGLVLDIEENPFLQIGLPETVESILTNILNDVQRIEYTPVSFDLTIGNPAIELGDRISVEDMKESEENVETFVMSYNWKYRGKERISAVGSNPKLSAAKSRSEKTLSDVESKISEQQIVFYSYTNAKEDRLTDGKDYRKLISIRFATLKDTTAEFKGFLNFHTTLAEEKVELLETEEIKEVTFILPTEEEVTIEVPIKAYTQNTVFEKGTVHFKYELDGIDMEFYPVSTIRSGQQFVNLFYTLGVKGKSIHTFDIWAKVNGCDMEMKPYSIVASLIGQGLVSGVEWDGTITIDEYFPLMDNNVGLKGDFIGEVDYLTRIPHKGMVTEGFGYVGFKGMAMDEFVETIGIKEDVT